MQQSEVVSYQSRPQTTAQILSLDASLSPISIPMLLNLLSFYLCCMKDTWQGSQTAVKEWINSVDCGWRETIAREAHTVPSVPMASTRQQNFEGIHCTCAIHALWSYSITVSKVILAHFYCQFWYGTAGSKALGWFPIWMTVDIPKLLLVRIHW